MRLKVGPHWGFFLGPSLGEKWEERSDEEVGEWGHGRVMDGLAKEGERVERPKKVRFTTWRSDEFSTGSYTLLVNLFYLLLFLELSTNFVARAVFHQPPGPPTQLPSIS